jgi:regulator of sigma E protease
MAILSINLGLINLLPIPALDGGYILLYAYELIFKKPLPSKIQILLLKFGFIFLLMLMFLITAFDLGF